MIPEPSRLRALRAICLSLAASVVLSAGLSWLLVRIVAIDLSAGLPGAVPLTLTALAMILILLSSRLRGSVLRGALPRPPGLAVNEETIVAAYKRATLISFALLEGAGALGLLVGLLTGEASYGMALAGAALVGMATRWPNEGELDRILRGRLVP